MGSREQIGPEHSLLSHSTPNTMKTFILCLAVVAVSGDAKPWTIGQIANGEHIKNALAEGRGHNVGVITNAAIAPTPHAVNTYGLASTVSVPAATYAYAPYHNVYSYAYPSVYYGKRSADADPWTVAQADAGVTQVGGVALNYAVPTVHTAAVPVLHSAYYGKREAYTPAQVTTGQTNGGVLTFVDAGHGTGHRPIVAAPAVYTVPHHVYYGKREAEAEPYTLAQVAAGHTAGGVITSVGGQPVVPFRSIPAAYRPYSLLPYSFY